MRKILVLAVLIGGLLTVTSNSNAQLFYGVKGGYTGYKLTGSDTYGGMNYVYGPSGGLILGLKFKIDFNLQTEILYTSKGVHQLFTHKQTLHSFQNDTTPVEIYDLKKYNNILNLQYVEIPVLFKKSFSLRGGVGPYERTISKIDFDLFLGPYFGYRFGASTVMSTKWLQDRNIYGTVHPGTETSFDSNSFYIGRKSTVESFDTSVYAKEIFLPFDPGVERFSSAGLNAIDAGVIAGLGLSLEVSESSKLTFDLRYSMGFLSIDKTYFNDVVHTFVEDNLGTIEIASTKFRYTTKRTSMDVKNIGFGMYLGFIKYL